MRWIHLSDLHFDPLNDGRCTRQMREKLIDYIIKHEITADHLFLTGDYRNAKYRRTDIEGLAQAAVDFILDIAKAAKINTANIHVIPGNHDLDRTEDTERINVIKKGYDVDDGRISKEDMNFLLGRFVFFKCLYRELEERGIKTVWSETIPRLHPYACFDDFSLLYLNTCIVCNSDADRHDLIIGNDDLDQSLKELRKKSPDKPIIVLAHHAIEYLRDDEKRIVEELLSHHPVRLYLCGDAHKLWGRRINEHFEITMGCMVQESWGSATFSVGEMRAGVASVEAHIWEKEGTDPDWTPFTNFNKKFSRNDTEVITKLSPVSPDKNFLGRKAKIDEIESALFHGCRMVLLYGMGGIGKTEICRKIFEEYQSGTSIVKKLGWIVYQNTVKDSFWGQFPVLNKVEGKLFLEKDNLADKDYDPNMYEKDMYWDAAKELLDSLGEELLLIIDNANEITQQEILMLEQLNCRLLLTSRSAVERITCIDVNQLEQEDCLRLYHIHNKDASPSDDKVIADIIALAAGHTLLVELLAKLQYATGQTAEQLYQRLCEKGFDLSDIKENISYLHNPEINQEGEWDGRFIEHVEMLFDISGICSKKEELEILQFFSLGCSGGAVPMRAVKEWMGLSDLNHVNALIKEGWLNRGNRNGVPMVEMHPLVSAAVCRMPDPDEKRVTVWVKKMADTIRLKEDETANDKLEFISFANAILTNLPNFNIEHIKLLKNVGSVYLYNGEYSKALVLFERALEMERSILGEKHLDIAETYNAIGNVYDGLHDYKEALSWFQKEYKMRELLGASHTDTAALYCNVASTYLKQGKYNEAKPWLEKAFAIQEACPDKEHFANTAVIYAAKGYACIINGRFDEAIGWYKKAVGVQENISGKEHPVTMEINGNIAKIYQIQGKYEEALKIYRRVSEVQERRQGKKHPNTTSVYRNIGSVYKSMECYRDALVWYEQALKIREEIWGKEHISTAILYNDLGMLYFEWSKGKDPKALEYFLKALSIHEKTLGVTDQNTKNVYRNLAITYYSRFRVFKALKYWKKYRGKE